MVFGIIADGAENTIGAKYLYNGMVSANRSISRLTTEPTKSTLLSEPGSAPGLAGSRLERSNAKMDNDFDLIIAKLIRLSRKQFHQLMEKLSDYELDYFLKSLKSYRDRYPYPLYQITHFN